MIKFSPSRLPAILAILLGVFSGSGANAAPACESPLAVDILAKVEAAGSGDILDTHDVLFPIRQYAIRNRKYLALNHEGEIDSTSWRARLQRELRKLGKKSCVDSITVDYYRAVVLLIRFEAVDEIVFAREVIEEWPSLQTYWFNQAWYRKQVEERFPTPELRARQAVVEGKLRKLFVRRVPGLGKIGVIDYLMLTYTRPEINLLADVFNQTMLMVTATSGKVVLENPAVEDPIEVELAPSEIVRFGLNFYESTLRKLEKQRFPDRKLAFGDGILAAYLAGDIDVEALDALLSVKDLKEPRKRFLVDLGRIVWSGAKIVLYQHPVTLPFITLGALVYEAVERKKEYEESEAGDSHLIRR